MDKNKKAQLRGAIGRMTDKIQQQEVAKLKAPFVEALQKIAQRQQAQHDEEQYYGDYSQLPGYKRGKNKNTTSSKPDVKTNPYKLDVEMPRYHLYQWYDNPFKSEPNVPHVNVKDGVIKKSSNPPVVDQGGIIKAANKENLIAGVLGGAASIGQYLDARNQDIYTPDIFQDNPYRNQIMNSAASLRISPYGPMRQIQDMNRRGMYMINNQGGLSGGQKYYANVASMLGAQQNMANAVMAAQEANNKYLQSYGEIGTNLGQKYATDRAAANQYSTEYASKAHAAQLQGMQMGQQNFLSQLQQYMANKNKIDMYNGMRSVYQQDVDDRSAGKLFTFLK